MKKPISTDLTEENVRAVLDLLAASPEGFARIRGRCTDAQLVEPLGVGERSIHAVLVHVLNCEARSFEAITLALLADEPLISTIHPERDFGKLFRLDRLPFDELLSYFRLRRRLLLDVLLQLSAKKWERTIRTEGKQRRESVYWQARGQALHELEHLQEIQLKLAGQGESL